jgi:hypothetical protein
MSWKKLALIGNVVLGQLDPPKWTNIAAAPRDVLEDGPSTSDWVIVVCSDGHGRRLAAIRGVDLGDVEADMMTSSTGISASQARDVVVLR